MLLEKLEAAIKDLELAKRDAEKTEGGNKSAGIRLRKDVKKVMDSLNELRREVISLREDS